MDIEKIESLSSELCKLIREIVISGDYEYSSVGGDCAYVKLEKWYFPIPIYISHEAKEIDTNFSHDTVLRKAKIRFRKDRNKAYDNAKDVILKAKKEGLKYHINEKEKELSSLIEEYEEI